MSFPVASTSSLALADPPVTPVRTVPLDGCPPRRTSRKRAPPSPLDAAFSSQRREYLFTLSTASNRRLLSPSTPTAPLLPPAPIFMPLPPTPSNATVPSTTAPSSSPMKRSPAMQALCRFTADAFQEEKAARRSLNNDHDEDRFSSPSMELGKNTLGLFDFYREAPSTTSSCLSSPELGGSPSSSDDDEGRWSDAPSDVHFSDADEKEGADAASSIVFARCISFDSATPSPQSHFSSCPSSPPSRTHVPHLSSFSITSRAPLHIAMDEPSSPVPSLTFSSHTLDSSPSSSSIRSSLSSSPSTPSLSPSPSPSPVSACISTFASTSFFSSPSPLLSSSSLAMRRLNSLKKRRSGKTQKQQLQHEEPEQAFGLGLSA
ncbi:hypothetical protein JCM8547_004196 [Rhodosporidiobolus lusitaniae]